MKWIKYFINEDKQNPKEIADKYFKDIPTDILSKFVEADPTSIIKNNKVKKIGSYVKFLVKIYRNKSLLLEDLPRAKQYLTIYNNNKSNLKDKDILKFNSLSDLGKAVRQYLDIESGELTPFLKELPENSYKLLFENDNWRVYKPLTEQAAAVLGIGTSWCTSWGKYAVEKNKQSLTSQFYKYKNNLLVFVDNNIDKSEWQLDLNTKQFNDKWDKNRFDNALPELLDNNIDLCYVIFPYLKDLENTDNLSSASKYLYLYPEKIHNIVKEKISSTLPINIFKKFSVIWNSESSDEDKSLNLLRLLNISNIIKDEFEDEAAAFVEFYKKSDHIEFKYKLLKKQLRNCYQLQDYLNYCNNPMWNDTLWESSDINISDIITEKELFGKGLFDDLKNINLEWINTYDKLKKYLTEEQYKKLINICYDKYMEEYNSKIEDFAKSIGNKVTNIIENSTNYHSTYSNLYINEDIFLNSLLALYIYKSQRVNESDVNLEDVIDYIFNDNDIPSDNDSFTDTVYKDFEFDNTEVLHETQVSAYDLIVDRKDELTELNKTDEERESEKQEELRKIEELKQKTLKEFEISLNKLGFKNWHLETDDYIIDIDKNKFNPSLDYSYGSFWAKVVYKNNNEIREGFVSDYYLNNVIAKELDKKIITEYYVFRQKLWIK